MNKPSDAPFTHEEFDKVYASPLHHWMWSDVRIPKELKAFIDSVQPKEILELGTGLGRYSRYAASRGVRSTGIDFSAVAIERAKDLAAVDPAKPNFLVGDVTRLDISNGSYDASFDVGCFHCLDADGQAKYDSEVSRVLRPGAEHLMWALDRSPSGVSMDPATVGKIFGGQFGLVSHHSSRRRLKASRWYLLKKLD